MGVVERARTGVRREWRLPARWHKRVLWAHIMVSVGLLGDSAGFLAIAIRGGTSDDPSFQTSSLHLLNMFAMFFGIPLSVLAIVTGATLGLGTKWGVFRYPWVTTKLILVVTVMLAGALVIGPAMTQMFGGGSDAWARLIAGGAWDVLALGTATYLSVFKPGGRFRRA